MPFEYGLTFYWSDLIEKFINQDEGGWAFTNDPNDPGGLTYGGMTYTAFNEGMKKYHETVSPEGFREAATLASGTEQNTNLRLRIKQVYFDTYLEPLGLVDPVGIPAADMLLSCAANLGIVPCVMLMQQVCNLKAANYGRQKLKVDGVCGKQTRNEWGYYYQVLGIGGLKQLFQTLWQKKYINMVQANASAWMSYVAQLEKQIPPGKLPPGKPRSNRAEYLEGWVNRTKRYA